MTASSGRQPKDRVHGVVYTPEAIADAIVAIANEGGARTFAHILEPSVGDGAFVSAMARSGMFLEGLVALDIDHRPLDTLRTKFPNAKFFRQDFLEFALSKETHRFDLIIGNPPYIRLKNFSDAFAKNVEKVAEGCDYPKRHLKNAWASFVVAAEQLLRDDGVLAFVVPYELMNVDYGSALQKSVFPKFDRVDVFVPDEKAFKQIDQDAVVLVGWKTHKHAGVFVHRVTNLEKLETTGRAVEFTSERDTATNLKAFLLDRRTINLVRTTLSKARPFSDFCKNSTGIVTAANHFFILSDEAVNGNELREWVKPILKKSTYLGSGPVFGSEVFDKLRMSKPVNLLDLNGYPPDGKHGAINAYLGLGEQAGVPDSYKARHRRNWYQVPITPKAPGFFFKRSHAYPRLCINQADVYVTDTAYCLHPLGGSTINGLCYSFYNSLTLLMAEIDGRFYGGGVLELTPNELRGLPLFYTEPSQEEFETFANSPNWGDPIALAKWGDQLLVDRHGFAGADLDLIHKAWLTIRSHRLRHS